MLTWARYLLIVSLTAVLLAGPALSAPSLRPSCTHQQKDAASAAKSCSVRERACCAARSNGDNLSNSGKSCCHRSQSPTATEHDAGCGSCPLGQCGCCQTVQGLTVVGVLPDRTESVPRVPSVRLTATDAVLFSRSDEPLLPPPIA